MIYPLCSTWRTAYDARGLPVAITDALGKTRTLLWDAAGQLITRTDCSGQSTHYEWDAMGHLAAAIDATGNTTRLLHDPLGRLLEVTQPDGAQQHYRWDADGNLCAYTDAQGATTGYRYDGLGQPVERTDAHGRTLRYDYDGVGRLVRLTNEVGAQYHFVYDSADNLVQESGFDGRTQRYAYNAAGELIAQAERAGWGDEHFAQRTGFARDAAGRLVEKRHAIRQHDGSTRETGGRTRYAYDALGRMTGCENGDAKVAFSYDPLSRLTNETQHQKNSGKTYSFTHTYDPLGNRTRSELPAGRTVDWLYYGSGHLHQIRVDGEVLSDIERDRLHRETGRSQGQLTSRYGFDPMGRLTEHRVSRHKADATALRDPGRMNANLPDGAQIARQYRYDPTGNLIATRDSLRGDSRYQYDPLGRIRAAERMLQGASTTERFDFDPAGNILNPNTGEQAGGTGGMGGAFGREIRDNRIAVYQDLRFQYDVHGNVTERLIGWHTKQDYRYSTEHQVASVTVTRYRDKPALKEAQAAHSQIDSGMPAQEAGQSPINVSNSDNATIQTTHYRYDPLGRRIEKRDAFGATTFAYDGDLLTWEERGSKATHYLYEPDSFVPLAKIEGEAERGQKAGEADRESSRIYYYHCDQIGAPQELTDEAGRIVWAAKYKVWGEIEHLRVRKTGTDDRPAGVTGSQRLALADGAIQTLDTVAQPLRFQGQYADGETGLHYNRARYYDPAVGRFLHQDPIGFLGGENFFSYGPNPFMWVDPLGLVRGKPSAGAPQHSSRTNVRPVNGRRPINHCFAGKTMVGKDLPENVRGKYPHGVPFNMNGFPDFSRYASKTVNIGGFTGDGADFRAANEAAFGKGNPFGSSQPPGMVWHHNEQNGKMQLIPQDIHDAVKHTGGASICGTRR
ncbi:RHS repeat-associated core domain-containing protein [Sphingomonas sp. NCPPB 2930]